MVTCPVCAAPVEPHVEETYLDARLHRVTAVGWHFLRLIVGAPTCPGAYRELSREPLPEPT